MQRDVAQNVFLGPDDSPQPRAFFIGWGKILAEHRPPMLDTFRAYCAKIHKLVPGRGLPALVEKGVQLYQEEMRNAEAAALEGASVRADAPLPNAEQVQCTL